MLIRTLIYIFKLFPIYIIQNNYMLFTIIGKNQTDKNKSNERNNPIFD